jgi:hypothetical protein
MIRKTMQLGQRNVRHLDDGEKELLVDMMDALGSMIHQNAVEHEFHDFSELDTHFMNRELMNLVTEATELRDAERDGVLFELCDKAEKMKALGEEPLTCIEEEYADIIIRAFDQLIRLTRNKANPRSVGQIILVKMILNQSRPIKHGRVAA